MDDSKPLVFLSGPYSEGDTALNVHVAATTFLKLLDEAVVTPYSPISVHLMAVVSPRPYESWLDYCLEMLVHCDAVYRYNATYMANDFDYCQVESVGAAIEKSKAEELGIPWFDNIGNLYDWVREGTRK